MQQPLIRNHQAGFTLVEILVSTALLAISVVGASYAYVSQQSASHAIALQSQAKQVMHETASKIEATPELFPYLLVKPGGNPITYVGCYSSKGDPLPNTISGNTGYFGTDLGLPGAAPQLPFRNIATDPNGKQICPQNTGNAATRSTIAGYLSTGMEIHVTRTLAGGANSFGQLVIHGMILKDGAANIGGSGPGNGNRQFGSNVNEFDMSVDTAMGTSPAVAAPGINYTSITLGP